MSLTPGDVRNVRFPKPRRREVGYDEDEVDAFLDRVEATLVGKDTLTAQEVDEVRFTERRRRKRGYGADAVDDFLDQVVLTLRQRATKASASESPQAAQLRPKITPTKARDPKQQSTPRSVPRPDNPTPPPPSRQAPTSVKNVPQPRRTDPTDGRGGLRSAPSGAPACDMGEVDAFLDRIQATLAGRDTLTPQEILAARFPPPAPGRLGYDESGVLAFLVLASSSLKQLTSRTDTGSTPPVRADAPPPRLTPEVLHSVRLRAPMPGQRGYAKNEVDSFLNRVQSTLAGRDSLTGQDVQAARFHEVLPEQGAYDQNEVEALLDLVADQLSRTPSGRRPASGRPKRPWFTPGTDVGRWPTPAVTHGSERAVEGHGRQRAGVGFTRAEHRSTTSHGRIPHR